MVVPSRFSVLTAPYPSAVVVGAKSEPVAGACVTKQELRKHLRQVRRDHVTALPDSVRALLFHRPPAPLLQLVPNGAAIGLYHASPFEAPAASYAKFFLDRGHEIALPRFASRNAPMEFARHSDPHDEEDLAVGPYGILQPFDDAPALEPDVLFVPLIGFTADGQRLGQGGGHYDRWLADHPVATPIGLAWDCQLVENLPREEHDRQLTAIVTPTRFYGPLQ